jgi:small nuclear ribonucleoprotein (snRNP)-like protein
VAERNISSIARCIKDIVLIWGSFSAVVTGSIYYFNEHYNLFIMHSTELGLVGLTIATSGMVWFTLSKKTEATDENIKELKSSVNDELNEIQKNLVRADVDRWYKDHINDDSLSHDELKYLHFLKNKLEKYKVNSFSQSQINKLLNKFDK